jgi:hypothetical protein
MQKNTKLILLLLLFTANLLSLTTFSQKKDVDVKPDTATNTQIQRALLSKGIAIKKEFIKVDDVRTLRFQILVVTNLADNHKTKGLYLDNQGSMGWSYRDPNARFAYLDENELDELIVFLENCDKRWKNEKPINHTEYVYSTNDNLRIDFFTDGGSKWNYIIRFTNYVYQNSVELSKKLSDDLVDALKKIKQQMATM